MAEGQLWERLLVAGVGPLITIFVGGLIVSAYVSRRTRDADLRHQLELEKAKDQRGTSFRADLVAEMARVAHRLDIAVAIFGRQLQSARDMPQADKLRERLEEEYLRGRADGEAIRVRLEVHYPEGDDGPSADWHAAMDCLTVLYFQALGDATDDLRRANARMKDAPHSGLTADELKNPSRVRARFREATKAATRAVKDGKLAHPINVH
jgi:hypothetical protein